MAVVCKEGAGESLTLNCDCPDDEEEVEYKSVIQWREPSKGQNSEPLSFGVGSE